MSEEPIIPAGHIFHGPDGMGYKLTESVYAQDEKWRLTVTVKSFGGAPEPEPYVSMPDWLIEQLIQFGCRI